MTRIYDLKRLRCSTNHHKTRTSESMNKRIEIGINKLNSRFGELNPVYNGRRVYYVDDKNNVLFFYSVKKGEGRCYINYEMIWEFFETFLMLEYNEIMELITRWIHNTYGLKGLTPECSFSNWLLNKMN